MVKYTLMRQRLYIPVTAFSGLQQKSFAPAGTLTITGGQAGTVPIGIASDVNGAALSKTSATDRTGITGFNGTAVPANSLWVSAGSGNPPLTEIGVSGCVALLMSTASHDIRTCFAIPTWWDRRHSIRFRVHWTSEAEAVGDRTIDWRVWYRTVKPGDAILMPTEFLHTPIPTSLAPTGVARALEVTDWGVLNAKAIGDDDVMLVVGVEMDAFNASFVENKYVVGLELEYTPRFSRRSMMAEGQPWTA